jgi:transcriptional regulator with XRE-family HTH domain
LNRSVRTADAREVERRRRAAAREAVARAAAARRRIVEDLERLLADGGISQRVLAQESGVPQPYLSRILAGKARPTLETYTRLAASLGADLAARVYPNTGPAIRDRLQATILEALLAGLHPRWRPFSEVAVRHPARGFIDAVLHDPRAGIAVATEVQSELRRLEQTIRWSREKADSLASWTGWSSLTGPPIVAQLLVVRRTRSNRDLARDFSGQLATAFPAHPEDALDALFGTGTWPGTSLVWVDLNGGKVRFATARRAQ